jgi:ADP-ribosylglycohydrolase
MHDPLDVRDLVSDELQQRLETGYQVSEFQPAVADRAAAEPEDLEQLYARLTASSRDSSWPYQEPERLADILDACPAGSRADPPFDRRGDAAADRVLAGWLGRIAGCNLGKPVEEGTIWTAERIRAYLELAAAYPLRDYIPALDPMPEGYQLRECWTETTRGNVHGSARDDDIDYSILAVALLEQHGRGLTAADVAAGWLAYLPYLRVFTAERAVYANLLRGVPVRQAAGVRNPYREWIGALIRVDVFGWVLPGRPRDAAMLAYADATLSHRANGVYAAMWAAALVSCAGLAQSVGEAFEASLGYVPAGSRLEEALLTVQRLYAQGESWQTALEVIQRRYGHYSWVHSVNNCCLIAAGLLWGDDDYATTVGLTVQGGWDTDSNAATAGSVVGTVVGTRNLPDHLIGPLQDTTRSAVFGHDHSAISELARRTTRLAGGLA